MNFDVSVIAGDGIGPEITAGATRVLEAVGKRFGHEFRFTNLFAGGCAIDRFGLPLPQETIDACKTSDSVLLGAVGGPKWDGGKLRPEQALLGLRKELGLFANIRPAKVLAPLKDLCPLKDSTGFDIMIVRELTGGIYFGKSGRDDSSAFDTESYNVSEIERICKVAFETAGLRGKHITSVDKANVLKTSALWRETIHRMAKDYPDITVSDMLVDNTAMQLVKNPAQFDVIVTSNLFGDILSDEAAQITGSIGLLPSASLGVGSFGMYEPIHGSAPDIAGRGIANPIATILSAAMMLKLSFSLPEEASAIENAVDAALSAGFRTADLTKGQYLSTTEMTDKIISFI